MVYGLVTPAGGSGVGGGGGGALVAPVDIPMVVPTNSTGTGVPLALYPPGADLSGFDIVDSLTGESVSGVGYTVSARSPAMRFGGGASSMDGGGGISPDDSTNDVAAPETGFFRVFHIPDWLVSFAGYQFDGPTFIPVDFSEPDCPTNYVENTTVLINGQPTDYAEFTTDNIGGTTYAGMGIYFDRMPNGTNAIQLLTTVRESDTIDDQTPYMVFSNEVQSIVLNNFVTYTNWSSLILSNSYTFNAQRTASNVNWEIDIYDVNDNFANYATGTTNGLISWTWDLTDYDGNNRQDDSGPFFYPYITIDVTPDPSGWTPPLASVGRWVTVRITRQQTSRCSPRTLLHQGAMPFQYTPPTVPTDYILLVHGWNMTQLEKDRYAECAFKRLYWQSYQGRFGWFRWPTGNGITELVSAALDTRNYDNSENQAWLSSVGLTNLLTQLNNEYPGRVYLMAHSMGNVVAGEALRRASQLVKIYVAMQGAVPAHAYDPSTPDHTTYTPPDDHAHYYTSGAPSYFSGACGAGDYVNFYNTNDYALGWWLFNQSKKPDDSPLNYPGYYYSSGTSGSGFYKILGPATNQTIYLNFPTDTCEIFAHGDPAWSYALGAEANVLTFDHILDLQSIWPPDPYGLNNYGSHFGTAPNSGETIRCRLIIGGILWARTGSN
jgi:hypothetical protein